MATEFVKLEEGNNRGDMSYSVPSKFAKLTSISAVIRAAYADLLKANGGEERGVQYRTAKLLGVRPQFVSNVIRNPLV